MYTIYADVRPLLTQNAMKAKPPLEKEIGRQCDRVAETLGWTVEKYEQSRATRIQEGLPDRRYVKNGARVWVELKRPKGKLTHAQYRWLLSELDAGGMATTVDNPEQLMALFQLLGRNSAIVDAEARRRCREWVDMLWSRGPRDKAV
jgi:hypothetical protein